LPRSGGLSQTGILEQKPRLCIFPKHDDFELSCEILPKDVALSKKTTKVWFDGVEIPYKQFRSMQELCPEDKIIFVLPPESEIPEQNLDRRSEEFLGIDSPAGGLQTEDPKNYLFIGYSKKQLYEEYMLVGYDDFFILNIIEEESYMIPMYQIVRILEYSHVMYLLEKTDTYGPNVQDDTYMTYCKPCKFQS
jgi:hypothetical protein